MLIMPKTIRNYQQILDDAEQRQQFTDRQLWDMKYIVDSRLHPQTKEFLIFPMGAAVLYNIPIILGLFVFPPTVQQCDLINQIIGQTLNQSYNFCFNYTNRNTSNNLNIQSLFLSYLGAIITAVGINIGTARYFNKIGLPFFFQRIATLMGIYAANTFNVTFSRKQDLTNGFTVYDDNLREQLPFKSYKAARLSFYYTWLSRLIIPLPILVSSFANYQLKKRQWMPRNTFYSGSIQIGITIIGIYYGLLLGYSAFGQEFVVNANSLEKEFHELKNSSNEKVTKIYFYKGV